MELKEQRREARLGRSATVLAVARVVALGARETQRQVISEREHNLRQKKASGSCASGSTSADIHDTTFAHGAGAASAVGRPYARRTPALILAALLGASCASTPPNAQEQTLADTALTKSVYAALNADPTYFFRHVDVRTHDGVAYLSGYVWSSDAIYRARKITRVVPGVSRVVTSDLELEQDAFGGRPVAR